MRQLLRADNVLMISPRATTGGSSITANLDTNALGVYSAAKANTIEIDVILGSGVNTNVAAGTIQLLESDDTNSSNFATIVANQAPALTAVGTLSYYITDMGPRKRYLRVSVTDGTATNDQFKFAVMARVMAGEEPVVSSDLATTAVII